MVVIWRFKARTGRETEFENAYGPKGSWARLFRNSKEYLGTELLHDVHSPGNYLTIDRWVSQEAYDAFRSQYRREYEALDMQCELLTEEESIIGRFEVNT